MIEKTLLAYQQIRRRISEQQTVMKELKKEEKDLEKEIREYLVSRDQNTIRLDDESVINLVEKPKKINKTNAQYIEYVKQLLVSRGIDDEDFTLQLLDKTRDVIRHQHVKIKKRS